jgi:hypothetical protein
MEQQRAPIGRRAALAGLGATAGAMVFADRAVAGPSASTRAVPTAGPVTNASPSAGNTLIGRADIRLAAADFRPASSGDVYTLAPGALTCGSTTTVTASFRPRAGDTLFDVTFYLNPGGQARNLRVTREGSDGTVTTLASGATAAVGVAVAVSVPLPVDTIAETIEGYAYTVSIDVGIGTVVHGAYVGVLSAASEFVLVDPFRVWDSRTPSGSALFPGANGGRIASGQTRPFTVDGFITRFAQGLLLNVAVVDTVNAGFLTFFAENPDDPTPPAVSSINWYESGQIVPNLVVTAMAGEADVTIACGGGGSTHYVIDCLGYFI